MSRTVVIRPVAAANLREHAGRIARRASPDAATRWLVAIRAAIERLATDADQFPEAEESANLSVNLRQMLHGRRPHVYRILFTIDGDTVNVLRLRHAAQDHLTEDDV